MADNPIKYADLIQPDDSIENLVKQLEEANKEYTTLAGNIKAQAVSISESLKGISGATELGRKGTVTYSMEAERLLKAERELNFARTETAKKIAGINAERKREQTEIKLTEQLNRSAAGSYDRLAAQYGLLKMKLNAMSEEERKNTDTGKAMEKQAADIYEEMKRLQEATGKHVLNVGNYQSALQGLLPIQGKWLTAIQQLGGMMNGGFKNAVKVAGEQVSVFGKQLLALLANPIVATIAAIAAAFLALKEAISSSEENTRALSRIMAPFERILTGVLAVLQDMAGWILKGVEGMEKMAMAASRFAERLPIVGKHLKSVNDALAENVRLTKEKQDLEDLERTYSVQNAAMARNAAKFRADAEKTSDPKRRAQLIKMAMKSEETAMYNELQIAKEDLRIKEALASQSKNDKKTNDELAAARARLYEVEERYYSRQVRLNSKLRKENEKMSKGVSSTSTSTSTTNKNTNVNDTQKIIEERQSIERKTQELHIQNIEDNFAREYQIIEYNYQMQIDDLRAKGEKEVELRAAINEQIIELTTQRDMKLAELTVKYAEKEKAELEKQAKEKERTEKEVYRTQVDVINQEAELRQMEIDNMEASAYEKQRLSIEAEKERLKKIYDLNVKAGKDLSSLEMRQLQEQMKGLEKETQDNKKNKDIYDLLGFNLSDEKKEAISSSFGFAMEQLNSYMNAWVQAADAKAQLAEKEVERAQNVLDAEIEARNQGYASDVETARKELELAKSNQDKALKEKEKAQKAQLAIETVTQASNLVSASALIWSQLGFPWAIPAIAVMWGSFAAAKIKAAEMTSSEQYGEGTVELLQGGSHQSGRDIDLGRKKDGTRRRAEGGEFFAVINKRNSRKYRRVVPEVINSLNEGTFERKYTRTSHTDILNATNIATSKYYHAYDGAKDVAAGLRERAIEQIVNMQNIVNPDLRRLGDDVRAIRRQGDSTTYTDERGTHVTYKNLHRIYKS